MLLATIDVVWPFSDFQLNISFAAKCFLECTHYSVHCRNSPSGSRWTLTILFHMLHSCTRNASNLFGKLPFWRSRISRLNIVDSFVTPWRIFKDHAVTTFPGNQCAFFILFTFALQEASLWDVCSPDNDHVFNHLACTVKRGELGISDTTLEFIKHLHAGLRVGSAF